MESHPSGMTGPVHVQEARAVRVGGVSSRKARPERPTGRGEVFSITNGSGSVSASWDARASSKSCEPTSAMAVNESGLGSSADGKGEEGIDRSFDRAAAPVHLGE